MDIGKRIMSLRKMANLSQKELARMLNINTTSMNRIELGTRPLKDDEIVKVSDIFDISADFLLGRQIRKNNFGEIPELKTFMEVAKKSSPTHIKMVTNLLQQLNEEKSTKKEPSSNEKG